MSKTRSKSLPISWKTVRLADVADVGAGNPAPQGVKYFENGDAPFIRTQDVGREHIHPALSETVDRVNRMAVESKRLKLWPAKSLLIPKSGASTFLNHRVLTGVPAYVASHLAVVVAKPNVLPEYLYYWSLTLDARRVAPDNDYPSLRLSDLQEVTLPLPPLPVQQHIISILAKADGVVRKRQDALDLADAILSASFVAMFGNPLTNGAQYPREQLGSVADVKSGVTKGRKLKGKKAVEVPYLRVANVQDGFLDLDEVKNIEVLPGDRERYRLEDGDILMTEGGDPDKLGRGTIWRNEVPDCIHQNHVFRVRTDRTALLPEYLAALLRTQYAKHYFLSCAKRSSNLASVNSTQVKAFAVPLPPIGHQQKFVMAVDQWDATADRLKGTLKKAEGTLGALLYQAFSGELTAAFEEACAEEIQQRQELDLVIPRLVALDVIQHKPSSQDEKVVEPVLLVTAMMKLMFLIQMKGTAKRRFYEFVPYHYGPFAKELYADLEKLQEDGLISIDNGEEDKTKITLADPAKAKELTDQLPEELREDVQAIIDEYGALKHNELLDRVYEEFPAYAKKSRRKKVAKKASKKASRGSKKK
ncbi:MAG: DUF4065 domain-containing protein [Rhodopirellula sp.]|nr:DUF4065 domain-containing protein [Rhodopirellula sp.]